VVITVPPGSLTISLTNLLPTTPGAAAGIPTSLMIVGQVGGGLGLAPTTTPSPAHATLGVSWPIAGTTPPAAGAPAFIPPVQNPRVQSFGTEVAKGATTPLLWPTLKPGTYLIESGTHPSIQGPMGLYGVLVVTTAPVAGSVVPLVLPAADSQRN
jgi:FtsP/CotA-like multicopper oxidase with cupredoxin domain